MKPFTYTLLVALLLISCGHSAIENKLIGKWSYSSTYSENVKADSAQQLPTAYMTYLHENIDEFRADHTEHESGEFEIYYDLTLGEYGVTNTIILEYKTDYQGTWKLDGDRLHTTGESCTFKYVKGYALRPNPYFDADYYVDLMKNYSDTAVIQPIIQARLAESETSIHEVNNDEMVVKFDNVTNMLTLTRIKRTL